MQKNNIISIAKALGIILMVAGHSGCPTIISNFIYIFHMPLFFVCSGYFFVDLTYRHEIMIFIKKRFRRLYIPYFKWSLMFLLLHNLFVRLNIYNNLVHVGTYQVSDFLNQFIKLVFMTDFELLIRPFWFIKELFYASIIVCLVSYIRSRFFSRFSAFNSVFLVSSLVFAIVGKYLSPLPLIGDSSVLFFSMAYYYSGSLLRVYNSRISLSKWMLLFSFLTVFVGSILFIGPIDMRFTTVFNLIPYYFLSIFGVVMIFCVSKIFNNTSAYSILYYIGNHTMPILAIHLFSLKLGNLLKIWIYDLPIDLLSSHTVILEFNSSFWLIYTLIGLTVPLGVDYLFKLILNRI